ncbi:tRNA(Glu)-specific nuclease WapA precursor [Posidoniimonas corsicana]|uniref:tRNA(Glu)-specific nuclease WapA n=1 Tax=Posidoniimonas corsicana TaxID=1938618 RepID=A0A5C5VGW8_9BACT|nr:RHS repeat-associated core domain-containing protein [Posidoniimonas corsicana]TWT37190.1 tRNA(Glu)-specific nuclease WapA precursor [Posidoniimonas corsicana]
MTQVTAWATDGAIQEIRREDASSNEVESWLYSYLGSSDPNEGLLSNVQMRQSDGSGGWDIVRQVSYEYYENAEDYGNLGDLKFAIIEDGSSVVLDTNYYRYYTPGEAGGYVHGLKYVFDAKSYARLTADVGDPTLASDSQVSPYAEQYFEYDEYTRATLHAIQGAGATASGGIGEYTYEYTVNSEFSDDFNDWAYKTVETLPGGNKNTFYTNASGAPLLKAFEDVNDSGNPGLEGEEWLTFYEYDSDGRQVMQAMSSAVTDYEIDGNNDLVVTLSSSTGLIHLTEYYTSTTATDTTSGGVASFFKASKVQQGTSGTPVLEQAQDYYVQTESGRTNVVLASDEVYRNTNGTGAETTSYAYTWFTDTVAVESIAVSLPVASASQNGSGSADVTTAYLDEYGRTVWTKDAAGYLSYTEYDPVTGAVVKMIDDVDTASTSDFSDLPSGWQIPTGGGLHLISTMEVDGLGRTIKLVDPVGNVTYTVYDDDAHEVRVYEGWDAASSNTTSPIQVYREDRPGSYTESLTYIWDDAGGVPVDMQARPTGAETLSDSRATIQSLSRTLYNAAGQAVATRDYSSLDGVTYSATPDLGVKGANYLESEGAFTSRGWMVLIADATGTSNHLFYDALGRLAQRWKGTDDVPTTDYNGDSTLDREDFRYWVEQNPNAVEGPAGTSMYKAALNIYDFDQAGGDSNQTETRIYFDSGANDFYTTYYEYDWRNRLTGTLEPDYVATVLTLDNLGRTTESQVFGGSSYSSNAIVTGDLRDQMEFLYDQQGRLYESRDYEVTVNSSTGAGTAGDYLPTDTWYDPRGYVAKTVVGAGTFQKSKYDGAGRMAAAYVSFDADENQTDYSAALSVAGDTVIEQAENWFDGNARMVAATTFKRLPTDSTSTGALTALNSYASTTANWFDDAGRVTHQVDYGRQDVVGAQATDFYDVYGDLIDTNSNRLPDVVESTAPEPNSSDNYLVTKSVYDPRLSDAGRIERQVDNLGRIFETQYDLLDRPIREIRNYNDGAVVETDTRQDITTAYEYDTLGRLATVTALNAKGSGGGVVSQATRYLYESPTNAFVRTGEVSADATDVLTQDQNTLVWSITTDNGDHVTTTYDWLDRAVTATDQRGVVHAYSYDAAGRLSDDTVTDLGIGGENVDGSIRRIAYAYDDLGRQQSITSYGDTSGTQVVNQIEYAYDGWGNLIEEWQANDGAVNTSTTPSVSYVYDDGASAGVAAHLRLTDLIYPNGRTVEYGYGSSGSIDDVLSRVATIGDGTNTHAAYEYLGLDALASEDYEEPEVKLDYSASNFDALDRFGRVADQVWNDYGSTPSVLDEYNYTYDRAGNRTARDNALQSSLDQAYEYDDLDQLVSFERGSGYTQDWGHDALGNWSSFDDDGTVQTRQSNAANEITSISAGAATPAYDRAGNMITTPKPGNETTGLTLEYDAWNRIVSASDGTTTVTYEYDGQDRRIERVSGGTDEHFYYDGEQVVETRLPDGQSVLQPHRQYVWSLRYIDSPILRDSYSAGVLVSGDRLYYLSDANHNITAVVNAAGVVQERYDYDPFGRVTIYDVNWANPTSTSSVGNTRFFAGQSLDVTTGLVYARARWYSTSIGGFVSRDPMGFAAGDMNLHRYVGNNSVIYVDPSGLYGIGTRSAIGGLAGASSGLAAGFAAGGVMGGPPGAAAGAVAGAIGGGLAGLLAGAFASPKASFGDIAAEGLMAGLIEGIVGGAFAGASAARAAARAGHAPPSTRGGFCFVAGTPVLQHADVGRLAETHLVQVESGTSHNSSMVLAVSATVIAVAGVGLPELHSRKPEKTNSSSKARRRQNSRKAPLRPQSAEAMAEPSNMPTSERVEETGVIVPGFKPGCIASEKSSLLSRARIKVVWLTCWLLLAGFFAIPCFFAGDPEPAIEPTPVAASVAETTAPIEQIQVGDRVTGVYSADELAGHTQVDPTTWRKVRLKAESRWEDGTVDLVHVSTLQPPAWVSAHSAEVGNTVPLPLDLLEMGLPENLQAVVVANEPCPPIMDGPGRVVLTTVDHLNDDLYELTFADQDGKIESVRTTGSHKFFRSNDDAWVSARELLRDDFLDGPDGQLQVQSLAQVPGVHRVYNMAVETDHVYRVSMLGALVHNNGCAQPRPDPVTGKPRKPPGFKADPYNNVTAKPRTEGKFLDDAERFLGDGYTTGKDGSLYSADGMRRVRFSNSDLAGHPRSPYASSRGPHGHFEFNGGRNIHIPLVP